MTLPRHLLPLVTIALVAGLLAGGLVALLDDSSSAAAPTSSTGGPTGNLPVERGPLRTAVPGVGSPASGSRPVPLVYPKIPGRDASVVGTVPDPYGGPPWAVRTFVRDNVLMLPGPRRATRGTVTCAQVGRMLRGRFVWIAPAARAASRVALGTTDNTVCGGGGRAGVVGALRIPVGRPGASRPTIAATVLWGLSRRPGTDLELRTRTGDVALPDLGRGARLVVRGGNHAVGAAVLRADGRPVRRGLDNQPFVGGGLGRAGEGFSLEGLRIEAVFADPAADRPRLLVTGGRGRTECWALTGSLVDGEPVRVVTRLGALVPSTLQCQRPFGVRADGWTGIGGSASSNGEQPTAERRRAVELRTLPGSSTSVIAVPPRVVALDWRGPAGVRTVRTVPVGDVRLAVLLGGGDLPLPSFGTIGRQSSPVYIGRDAAGRTVRLRERPPILPRQATTPAGPGRTGTTTTVAP
jgi:hypothetical protein